MPKQVALDDHWESYKLTGAALRYSARGNCQNGNLNGRHDYGCSIFFSFLATMLDNFFFRPKAHARYIFMAFAQLPPPPHQKSNGPPLIPPLIARPAERPAEHACRVNLWVGTSYMVIIGSLSYCAVFACSSYFWLSEILCLLQLRCLFDLPRASKESTVAQVPQMLELAPGALILLSKGREGH